MCACVCARALLCVCLTCNVPANLPICSRLLVHRCGNIVCYNCSKWRRKIPGQTRLQRVCDSCIRNRSPSAAEGNEYVPDCLLNLTVEAVAATTVVFYCLVAPAQCLHVPVSRQPQLDYCHHLQNKTCTWKHETCNTMFRYSQDLSGRDRESFEPTGAAAAAGAGGAGGAGNGAATAKITLADN